MPRTLRLTGIALMLAATLTACDSTSPDDYTDQIVVSAFVETNAPLPIVTVSRTGPLGSFFDPAERAVTNAQVTVTLLSASGQTETVTTFTHDAGGRYVPDAAAADAVGGRSYRLSVRVPGFDPVTAETTAPLANDVLQEPVAQIPYLTGQGPEVRITTTSAAGRQAVYIASIRALQPFQWVETVVDGDTLYRNVPDATRFPPVPFVIRFADCETEAAGTLLCGNDPSDAASGTSPLINEESYEIQADGSALVRIPWIGFGYYGPAQIELISVDPVFQAFVETQAIQGGGTTVSPGEIPNITSNVTGGLGIFGSFARVVFETTVTP